MKEAGIRWDNLVQFGQRQTKTELRYTLILSQESIRFDLNRCNTSVFMLLHSYMLLYNYILYY